MNRQLLRRSLPVCLFPVALAACEADPAAPVATGSSEQALSSFSSYVTSLSPVGYWRLGESSGTTTADATGAGHTGTFLNGPTLGQTGGVAGDSNTAVLFAAASRQSVTIPSSLALSLVKSQDDFDTGGALGSSWPAAPDGSTWVPAFSTGSYYSADSGIGRIHSTVTTGATYGQTLSGFSRGDVNVQVLASWDEHPATTTTTPVQVMARFVDVNNNYRAELRELYPSNGLELRIVKVSGGTSTIESTTTLSGTYTLNEQWYVRLQVEGKSLFAKAWKKSGTEPLHNDATVASWTDTVLTAAGSVGIRSSNSSDSNMQTVSFDEWRVQSVGMSVHVLMKPTSLTFTGEGTAPDKYVHWLGKGNVTDGYEWGFRMYSADSGCTKCNRVSAYMWNASGGEGAGAHFQPGGSEPAVPTNAFTQLVAVFDPGDALDLEAGVSLYRNGVFKEGPSTAMTALYSYVDYLVRPQNTTAPLNFATRNGDTTHPYFSGAIDEVVVFDRRLQQSEITSLNTQIR